MTRFIPALLAAMLIFPSCMKEEIFPSGNITQPSPEMTLQTDHINIGHGLYYNSLTGSHTLVLQPGKDGNDLWFKNWEGHPFYADTCDTDVPLIKALAWKLQQTVVRTRSVIKFDSLLKIPASAQILSATLYLYGPSPNSPAVHTHLPMGNSSYPGSIRAENSTCIQRITSSWDKHTICWNNQPATTTLDQVILSPSSKQWQYDISADVTGLVKPMIQDPAKNYGFMLKLQNEAGFRSMGFFSSDYHEPSKRPKLVVEYN